jgi:SH3-like domain-containing protein
VLYNAKITIFFPNSETRVYEKPDVESKILTAFQPGREIQVTAVEPNFVQIRLNGGYGWVLRHRIMEPISADPGSIPRFGTVFNHYYATADRAIEVKAAPDAGSQTLITLNPGAQVGFLDVTDGWARTIFKRQYGFVDTRTLGALEMVAPSEEAGTPDVPIAVYNSFYDISDNENNHNRINNLKVGGQRMSRTLQPGEALDFNDEVGPFQARNGYMPAGALVDGELVFDVYGGGSCQVSSTLYNVVLQLDGLTVLRRSPHGANGAKYLPHGVDASSGALNFVFRNDYPFPVSIHAHVQDGSLFIAMYREP